MFRLVLSAVMAILALNVARVSQAADSPLPGNHPLNEKQAGDLLVSQLRCAACHAGIQSDPVFEKLAPDLSEVGTRLSHDYIQRFIESPAEVHHGTTMPNVLASKSAEQKKEIAEALTHFLIAQNHAETKPEPSQAGSLDQGKKLFHTVGCVACHGPREVPIQEADEEEEDYDDEEFLDRPKFAPIAVSLDHVPAKYDVDSLGAFLFQPLLVRPSGRMPDMKLTREEADSLARYLTGQSPPERRSIDPEPALVAKGKQYFTQLNCAACHATPGMTPAPKVVSLQDADWTRGCLSDLPGPSPHYELAAAQAAAIAASFREASQKESDKDRLAKTLTAFKCIACHRRDEYGGVHDDYNSFFETTEKNLGDDGRIPPPLTGVEAKLRPLTLKKVLFDGESVRPYMLTRMPQYGSNNLRHLPDLLQRLHAAEAPEFALAPADDEPELSNDEQKERRAAARVLLGDKGLNCVACHNFNGIPAQLNKGIDLLTMPERLNKEWFHRFLRNPGAFRARTIMPTAWPNGVAAYKDILDGNTDDQINAIWDYLSLGTSAQIPPGIQEVNTPLAVGDQARVYRGRSRVAGFRGIAVGLPEQLNYAFNAETGTLSAIWSGEFVRVNWSGQGAGDFNPAANPITLAQDVSFVQLDDQDAPWPLLPVMTKEAPVNPDPLYPKNHGYQFQGYYLNDASIPTFMYRLGSVKIEDSSVAIAEQDAKRLQRKITFDSPEPQTIWFRALTGEINKASAGTYRSGKLRLSLPQTDVQLRPQTGDKEKQELLLRLSLPQGKSAIELNYELLHE
ncbi:cytochrome c4 [Blastopirellula marina]|nr:c-type cytochrome [Blastopirellula marina]